ADHSFKKGGMVQKVRFGYRKLSKEEAASGEFAPAGLRLVRRPECTPILQEMRRRVLRGDSYDAVADCVIEEGMENVAYVKSGRWTGKLIKDLLRDPILGGTRTYRDIIYHQVFKTGKYRRSKNADGPEERHYPELAHFNQEEHADLLEFMATRSD